MKIYQSKHNSNLKLVWFNDIVNRPNLAIVLAMMQCYSPDPIYLKYEKLSALSEDELGRRAQENALKFGHFGIMEHAGTGLMFNIANFPHEIPVQHRTHRLASFAVMSQRYTGKHFLKHYEKFGEFSDKFIKKYFYFDVIGQSYSDREGGKYVHTEEIEKWQIANTRQGVLNYCKALAMGIPEEKARRELTQRIKQHYIHSVGNLRAFLHVLSVRSTDDVQIEFRWLSELFMEFYQEYNPYMADIYAKSHYGKNKLTY
jgi:flavin-dependent thymidylate synthase